MVAPPSLKLQCLPPQFTLCLRKYMWKPLSCDDGDDNRDRRQPVLESFSAYYQPLKNVPFERYKFYSRVQEGRKSHDHYRTTQRQLADRCEFETMTENKILQEKLVFGIQD